MQRNTVDDVRRELLYL